MAAIERINFTLLIAEANVRLTNFPKN